MQYKTLLKVTAVAASFILLAACGTSNMSKNRSGQSYGGGAGGDRVMGTDLSGSGDMSGSGRNRLRAPQNQSYYFDFDKSEVHQEDIAAIDAQANYLVKNPQSHVLLAGNTDARGSREYNIALGERRARGVEDRMKMDGVNGNQVRTISYGAEKPVAVGNSESDYQKNRRADLSYQNR